MGEGIMAAIVRLEREGRKAAEDAAAAAERVMTEREYLTGEAPHPAAVAHMQHAIDRVQPPSLVKLDRAEAALAAVVARRNLEQSGQFLTDQWWDLKRYEDSIVDRYIEETT